MRRALPARAVRGRRGRPLLSLHARVVAAATLAAAALVLLVGGATTRGQTPPSTGGGAAPPGAPPADPVEAAVVEDGGRLFAEGCSSCHGFFLEGVPDRGPNLRGAGELAADFYLRTGRMPLENPEDQPVRSAPSYTPEERAALVAYVGEFGGPGVPAVAPAEGDISDGLELFSDNCAGCHQIAARGGITTDSVVPDLQQAEPVDVAEAVEIGPYTMPVFSEQLSQTDVNSIARYVEYAQDPADEGGWGIGHIGPIPEGMVAWFLAGAALLLVIRLIGERTTE